MRLGTNGLSQSFALPLSACVTARESQRGDPDQHREEENDQVDAYDHRAILKGLCDDGRAMLHWLGEGR